MNWYAFSSTLLAFMFGIDAGICLMKKDKCGFVLSLVFGFAEVVIALFT